MRFRHQLANRTLFQLTRQAHRYITAAILHAEFEDNFSSYILAARTT
jgi:hypothetical protein